MSSVGFPVPCGTRMSNRYHHGPLLSSRAEPRRVWKPALHTRLLLIFLVGVVIICFYVGSLQSRSQEAGSSGQVRHPAQFVSAIVLGQYCSMRSGSCLFCETTSVQGHDHCFPMLANARGGIWHHIADQRHTMLKSGTSLIPIRPCARAEPRHRTAWHLAAQARNLQPSPKTTTSAPAQHAAAPHLNIHCRCRGSAARCAAHCLPPPYYRTAARCGRHRE